MKVVHLPVNIASVMSNRVRALRADGMDAIGYSFRESPFVDDRGLRVFRSRGRKWRNIPLRLFKLRMAADLLTCNVVHWYGNKALFRTDLLFRLLRISGKKLFVEWLGSDIRKSRVEELDNPVYTNELDADAKKQYGDDERSRASQRFFGRFGFLPIVASGMLQYIERPGTAARIEVPIFVDELARFVSRGDETKIRIVHAPSSILVKGSRFVRLVVEELREKYPDMRYAEILDAEKRESLSAIGSSDIFIDQLVLGDRGVSAMEAMAMGKPVVCYIKPSLRATFYADCPIVSAEPSTLHAVLEELIQDADLRKKLGIEGREYVKRHHDPARIADELRARYGEVRDPRRHYGGGTNG